MRKMSEEKRFSIVARARSFNHAFRGIFILFKTQPNAWIHLIIVGIVIFFGCEYNISNIEWIMLVLAMGFVLTAEAFNTSFEFDIDLTSPEFHPYARDTKDIAAGAVLISVITAIVIGLIIFIPKVF